MNQDNEYSRKMTIASLVEDDQGAELTFLESARFYRLPKENPDFSSFVQLLRDASESGRPLEITTESIASETIVDVVPRRED